MNKVLCFGELLLRLSPDMEGEWIENTSIPTYVGGAELNAATALAKWKVPVKYVSAIPDNFLSVSILARLNKKEIDVQDMVLAGDRIGIYYLLQGADLKHTSVIYDRAASSFSQLQPGKVDWDKVLQDVSWFHFSAISPALNATVAAVCKEALQAAAQKNITISVDLNHRAKLWQYGKQPVDVMPELVQYCDVIMGNIWAAETMLHIPIDAAFNREEKASCLEQAQKTSATIMQHYPKCRQVANTFRFDQEGAITYYAALYKDEQLYVSPQQRTSRIIDKVGSGDCFMAGLIYGNYLGHTPQDIIDFAAAAAFNKLFIKGDATTTTVEDIRKAYLNYV
jgi:2-dehydro-3-deoxygluconokinase